MASRLQLQRELEEMLGNKNVYYQPPESLRMKFPCVVYKKLRGFTRYADDIPYTFQQPYELTYITSEPDSPITYELAMKYPTIRHMNSFVSDNRYHEVFELRY
jgi:hypothetical protein